MPAQKRVRPPRAHKHPHGSRTLAQVTAATHRVVHLGGTFLLVEEERQVLHPFSPLVGRRHSGSRRNINFYFITTLHSQKSHLTGTAQKQTENSEDDAADGASLPAFFFSVPLPLEDQDRWQQRR